MTDLGCLYLALGFTAGLAAAAAIVSNAVRDNARWNASARESLYKVIADGMCSIAEDLAAAYRHRTDVSGGFLRPPEPEPPPPDPRVSKGIEFIEHLGLSAAETDDLIGGYEMLAGVRAGEPAQIKAYLQRFRRLGVPLPS